MHPQAVAEARARGNLVGRPRIGGVADAVAAMNDAASAPGTQCVPPVTIAVRFHPVGHNTRRRYKLV